MAEYINRALVDAEFMRTKSGSDVVVSLYEHILDIPTADVIEREKIDKAIEEIENLSCATGDFSYSDGLEKAVDILKKHIDGEVEE